MVGRHTILSGTANLATNQRFATDANTPSGRLDNSDRFEVTITGNITGVTGSFTSGQVDTRTYLGDTWRALSASNYGAIHTSSNSISIGYSYRYNFPGQFPSSRSATGTIELGRRSDGQILIGRTYGAGNNDISSYTVRVTAFGYNLISGIDYSQADATKLAQIETRATRDQSNAEIVAAVNAGTGGTDWQTGGLSGAELTKFNSIETNAKDDQTGAEIEELLDTEIGTFWRTGRGEKGDKGDTGEIGPSGGPIGPKGDPGGFPVTHELGSGNFDLTTTSTFATEANSTDITLDDSEWFLVNIGNNAAAWERVRGDDWRGLTAGNYGQAANNTLNLLQTVGSNVSGIFLGRTSDNKVLVAGQLLSSFFDPTPLTVLGFNTTGDDGCQQVRRDHQGADGTNGVDGAAGSDRADGAHGDTGPRGEPVRSGRSWETMGDQGIQGEIGPSGGPVGPQGDEGPAGPEGPAGSMGNEGPRGIDGIQGVQGEVGPQGLSAADAGLNEIHRTTYQGTSGRWADNGCSVCHSYRRSDKGEVPNPGRGFRRVELFVHAVRCCCFPYA